MDGFHINGQFLFKELAINNVKSNMTYTYLFKIGYTQFD